MGHSPAGAIDSALIAQVALVDHVGLVPEGASGGGEGTEHDVFDIMPRPHHSTRSWALAKAPRA